MVGKLKFCFRVEKFIPKRPTKKYSSSDPSKQIISAGLAGNLIPLSTVENLEYKAFVAVSNLKCQVPSRKHQQNILTKNRQKMRKSILKEELHLKSVCLTIDLWSNKKTSFFLGTTGHHFMDWCMKSVIISCKYFKG